MAKSKTTSIRLSNEVIEIVNNYNGKNFTERLENLILYCFKSLPKLEDELSNINKQIKIRHNELNKLISYLKSAYDIKYFVHEANKSLNDLLNEIENISKEIKM